ncbi:hypothetical protein DV736_g5731, partial [Chaetothyriales sp. CBS 134916]
MEDPVAEISGVIKLLCTTPPHTQHATLEKYFTKNASFLHPVCRVDSFANSRWFIGQVYLWYKIMTPKVDITSYSIGYDKENLVLYVTSQQYFKIWFLPAITPRLLSILILTQDVDDDFNAIADGPTTNSTSVTGKKKYYIKSQKDMYEPNELVRYFTPYALGTTLVTLVQIWATIFCVIGSTLGFPIISLEDSVSKSITKNKGSA